MNPLYVLAILACAATAQYSDPASHGFTINAPGLTNTATFGYGTGASSVARPVPRSAVPVSVVRPSVRAPYAPLSSSGADSSQVVLTQRSFTLSNVGSVGGPTGSVIGERRLLTSSNAVLPRQRTGTGVPTERQGAGGRLATTVVTLSNRGSGSAPAPLSNYYGGASAGRLVSTGGTVGSPFNPTIQREPSRYQYAPPQARGNFAPSHGYTVNAPGFTKHKTFAGPAVHGTNQAFLHASSG